MPDTFPLTIATPFTTLFDDEAVSLRVQGAEGQMGVLAGHAPLVAELEIGEIVLTDAAGDRRFFASTGGVLRVTSEGVSIVSESAEAAEEIDIARAQQALERAQRRLQGHPERTSVDLTRAQLALARALNRLRVAQHASGD